MLHIKIFGEPDSRMRLLKDNLALALNAFAVDSDIREISEPGEVLGHGVRELPALMLDGELVIEGAVPTVQEINNYLRNRYLYKSKIYRLRSIAAPVDMSEASANALLYAAQISRHTGARLEAVYAMDSIFEGERPSSSGFLSSYQKTMRDELMGFVQKVLTEGGMDELLPYDAQTEPGNILTQVRTEVKVLYGTAESALIAHSKNVDLIVMGSTGSGSLGKKLFGSVSVEVSKNAHCPALFVPPSVQFQGYRNILYASHFDSLDTLRIKQAVSFAQRFRAQLHFVHAGPGPESSLELERKLFEINYHYANPEWPFIFNRMMGENVAEQLYEYAFQHKIDLIVMVTHQRSFWESFLHRSVTRQVLENADMPVLVLHADNDMAE